MRREEGQPMPRLRTRLSYANVAATLALFMAMGIGSAWAIATNSVGSAQLKRGAVKPSDLAANAVSSSKVADGSLVPSDFASGQIPAGPPGPQGPAGSPDTPQQVIDKAKQADGSGSGLDADTVDGVSSADLGRAYSVHRAAISDDGAPEFASLPLGPVGTVTALCADGVLDQLALYFHPKTSSPATINRVATTADAEPLGGFAMELQNGTHRAGSAVSSGPFGVAYLSDVDGTAAAASELTVVLQQDGAAATLTLHLFVGDGPTQQKTFCELTGSVVRGPAL
jgi:hypothetical protein